MYDEAPAGGVRTAADKICCVCLFARRRILKNQIFQFFGLRFLKIHRCILEITSSIDY